MRNVAVPQSAVTNGQNYALISGTFDEGQGLKSNRTIYARELSGQTVYQGTANGNTFNIRIPSDIGAHTGYWVLYGQVTIEQSFNDSPTTYDYKPKIVYVGGPMPTGYRLKKASDDGLLDSRVANELQVWDATQQQNSGSVSNVVAQTASASSASLSGAPMLTGGQTKMNMVAPRPVVALAADALLPVAGYNPNYVVVKGDFTAPGGGPSPIIPYVAMVYRGDLPWSGTNPNDEPYTQLVQDPAAK